jgi:hypothetical protein
VKTSHLLLGRLQNQKKKQKTKKKSWSSV